MSIETQITELIAALDRNTKAHGGVAPPTGATAGVAMHKAAARVATPTAEVVAAVTPPRAGKTLTYEDIRGPFLEVAKVSKEQALALLKPYGLENLKGAKPENFAAILASIEQLKGTLTEGAA